VVDVIALACTAMLALASQGPSPQSIRALLEKRSADTVVAELFGDHRTWSAVEAGIASGDHQWLQTAARLYPGCDAGICYALKIALGEALAKNPRGVLAAAGGGYSARDACSTYGYVTDSSDLSLPRALAAIRVRQNAVRAVKDRSLASKRQECLLELRALQEQAPRSFK
jgi:hypothetical protein